MSPQGLRLYLILFFLVGGAALILCRVGLLASAIAGCRPDTNPNVFMAYCHDNRVGDYEHGAFYFGLEPTTLDHLRRAKVLFLGNSRAQVAFSTDSVERYFAERETPYYLLGFGYDESAAFAEALIEKEHLSPKALVIVADPFFRDILSPPAAEMVGRDHTFPQRVSIWQDYLLKKWFGRGYALICRKLYLVCTGANPAIYRSVTNGMWIWRDYLNPPESPAFPVRASTPKAYDETLAAADASFAAKFLKIAQVPGHCVILTVAPNSIVDAEGYARTMGRLLGANVVVPKLADIDTFDGSHMTWSSAQRWSEKFLDAANPIFARCTNGIAPIAAHDPLLTPATGPSL